MVDFESYFVVDLGILCSFEYALHGTHYFKMSTSSLNSLYFPGELIYFSLISRKTSNVFSVCEDSKRTKNPLLNELPNQISINVFEKKITFFTYLLILKMIETILLGTV